MRVALYNTSPSLRNFPPLTHLPPLTHFLTLVQFPLSSLPYFYYIFPTPLFFPPEVMYNMTAFPSEKLRRRLSLASWYDTWFASWLLKNDMEELARNEKCSVRGSSSSGCTCASRRSLKARRRNIDELVEGLSVSMDLLPRLTGFST